MFYLIDLPKGHLINRYGQLAEAGRTDINH